MICILKSKENETPAVLQRGVPLAWLALKTLLSTLCHILLPLDSALSGI